jgi:hypothetical protein
MRVHERHRVLFLLLRWLEKAICHLEWRGMGVDSPNHLEPIMCDAAMVPAKRYDRAFGFAIGAIFPSI